MKVRWTDRARHDLAEIGRYIARDSPSASRRWIDRLLRRATRAARFPQAGRAVPELGRPDVREVFVGTYRLVYLLSEGELQVVTVFEGHRLWPGVPELDEEEEQS